MATLFERIVGIGGNKIPIHAIRGMSGEISRGQLSPGDVISTFGLDAAQQADLGTFLTKLSSHPDKAALSVIIFDFLALAELGILPDVYRSEQAFWDRIDAELALAAG